MFYARVALGFLLMSAAAVAQQYTISTFAGGGLPVNIPGTSASLRYPGSVAVDRAGNLFFADGHNVVLRLDATTGVLTLAAGNGTPGFSGDNGPATGAQVFSPYGIAVDSAGSLFIADSINNRIRKVSNGVITTVAGNGTPGSNGDNSPATSAQLSNPKGVAVDSSGNLYIADSANNSIRKVSNGVITTVAGNGTRGYGGDNGPAASAQLRNPNGLAVDASGNLYIADSDSGRIRKVSNGVITTVAGGGTSFGDNGPATSAQLSIPYGVAVDSAGDLYIVDGGNYRIRKVSNGVITTVAGNGTQGSSGDNGPAISAQFSNPLGVAVDTVGNLYIADANNNRVRKVSNGVITTVAGGGTSFGDNGPAASAQLFLPAGLGVDSASNLYIADSFNNRILKVSNGVITTVAGSGPTGGGLGGFSGDNGPATSAQLSIPYGVAVDSASNLYIADNFNNRIRKVTNGVITTVAGGGTSLGDNGPATSAQLSQPYGVAVDSAGNLYIGDAYNNRVRKVSNGIITTVAGNGAQGFGGDNGPATSAQFISPFGVAVDSAGNLYIVDGGNYRIRKVSNGVITTVAGNGTIGSGGDNGPATSAQLWNPYNVAVDSAGNLYIADSGNNRIRKVSNGVITTVAGNGTGGYGGDNGPATSAQLNIPQGLAVDSAGEVYVADSSNDRIRILLPSGPSCSASVSPTTLSPVSSGGNLSVTIQTSGSCPWAVQGLPAWITYSGTSVGTGPATITLVAAANTGPARSATISIAGVSIPVTQSGGVAVYTCTNTTLPVITSIHSAIGYGGYSYFASGSWLEIYGTNLADPADPRLSASTNPGQWTLGDFNGVNAPTMLDGISVSINGKPANVWYLSPTQLNVQAPADSTAGNVAITATNCKATSSPVTLTHLALAPGFLAPANYSANGTQYMVATFASDGAYVLNTSTGVGLGVNSRPAKPGDLIVAYGIGFGDVNPSILPGVIVEQSNTLVNPVTISFGSTSATLSYSGLAGSFVGLYEFYITVPSSLANGDYQINVTQNGTKVPQTMYLTVHN